MWRPLLGSLVVAWGLAAGSYLLWCQHRVSGTVLMGDRAWPRPAPYPDRWLARLYDQLEAENPVPPGVIKFEGEIYTLQGRVRVYTLAAFVVIAAGMAILLWPSTNRQSSWWPSVRRGIAIGLVIGVAWTAFIAHLTDGPDSVWLALPIFTIGFAFAGAVAAVVRYSPELVGLCTAFLIVVLLADIVRPDVYLDQLLRWNHPLSSSECLSIVVGVHCDLTWLVVFGGSSFLWGPVIGGICRVFRPAVNGDTGAAAAWPHE
jgi:hypothetical protein